MTPEVPMTHSLDDALVEKASEAVYDFLHERFPDGALPGGKQLFADDHLDAEFKHEAGCEELARAALEAAGVAELREEIERLRGALALAVPIIELERDIAVSCNTVLYKGSPDFGKVVDAEAVEEIAAYDEALAAARAALNPRQNEEEGE